MGGGGKGEEGIPCVASFHAIRGRRGKETTGKILKVLEFITIYLLLEGGGEGGDGEGKRGGRTLSTGGT